MDLFKLIVHMYRFTSSDTLFKILFCIWIQTPFLNFHSYFSFNSNVLPLHIILFFGTLEQAHCKLTLQGIGVLRQVVIKVHSNGIIVCLRVLD